MSSPAGSLMLANLTAANHHPPARRPPASPHDPWRVGLHAPRHDPPSAARAAQATDRSAATSDRDARRSAPGWLDRSAAFLTQQLVAAEPERAAPTYGPPAHRVYDRHLAQRMGFAGPLAPVDVMV